MISQPERPAAMTYLAELINERDRLRAENDLLRSSLPALQAENEMMRKALEMFANTNNWSAIGHQKATFTQDFMCPWEIAKEALAKVGR